MGHASATGPMSNRTSYIALLNVYMVPSSQPTVAQWPHSSSGRSHLIILVNVGLHEPFRDVRKVSDLLHDEGLGLGVQHGADVARHVQRTARIP